MMNGKWSRGCHLCRDPEMIGSHSMRQDYVPVTNYYDPATGAVDLKGLRHVELRFSNSCNMACKHCSVVYSSGWVSKLKHYQPDAEVEKLKGLDVLVVNALRIEPHVSHFNLEEALAFIKRVNPKKAFLTHLSHHLGFHNDIEKILPETVNLAYDQLQISI